MKLFFLFFILLSNSFACKQEPDLLSESFIAPPDHTKPLVYWWWLFNRVDKESITRDLEEFKAKGIGGVNLMCNGGYSGLAPLPGVKYQSPEWWELFRHAVKETKRLNIELGFNLSAGGWTMQGPWVTPDHAMKKVVQSELKVTGPKKLNEKLPQPEIVDDYYNDICVQAVRIEKGTQKADIQSLTDVTGHMQPDGNFDWQVPEGEWVILRTGYTLTGHLWSRWFAYPGPPQADTYEGGDGYEIDYLSKAALDDHFNHLGKPLIEEARKAGGKIDYFWSDSWECGKLTWTQDFPDQFQKYRGYDLMAYLPVLAGYTIGDSILSARFLMDFDRTIQDCIADNFYGHFADLCHQNGMTMGSEAGGPNDIPPIDALKNLGRCDFTAGEFWVNGHYKSPDGYNGNRWLRLNLKQTATAAHMYGKKIAMAEAFTQQEPHYTHWSLGPAELKPYANDAFCEGINHILLHQATCQPIADGKPGYEFCAGQHFTPNITWWEQSQEFFSYLSRCQYLLQEGHFVGDVCYYLGERPPVLAPPKYLIPDLGPGYDCDYTNAEVLLTRMSVKDGKIVLPDGMSYRLLVLQNCTSPSAEISREVGRYQQLDVSPVPSTEMSVEVIKKIRELVLAGATIIGAPPKTSGEVINAAECDKQVQQIAAELWGDLDGKDRTERRVGKGRVIWGKTAREVLLADGIKPDFTFTRQTVNPEMFDYIHRTTPEAEIYFVINRTNREETADFTFRVSGKQPEIWDPVTGQTREANAFIQAEGCTTLPLQLDPFGSYFVLFRKPVNNKTAGKAERNFPAIREVQSLSGPWNVAFDPEWGGPANINFPELISWTEHPEESVKYYSGTATYRKKFDLPEMPKSKEQKLFIDLGEVKNLAGIRLNGKNLGILWCHPWRLEITDAVKPTENELEIDIINLWTNRVVGDLNQPEEKRFTKTHEVFRFDMLTGNTPLLESGLLGPVRIVEGSSY
ncbi:MAG: glycosyl hydrolase [Tannerellaceae bacterium]|nr:glycosyl hydrolase [Tannerellaceae bacterium]